MASLKYEISLLDCNTRFALWQIKMQVVLVQMDLEDALLGINKMPSTLTNEEKKRKDRKALTQLHLHLSNKILQDVMKEKTAAALWKRLEQICMSKTLTSKLHMKQRLYAHHLEEGAERVPLLVGDKIRMLIMIVEGHRNGILANKIKREAANQKGKQPENFGEADIVEDYSDGELLVTSINDSKSQSGLVYNLRDSAEGVVLMGNNASCKIAGVETIKVKIFDGFHRTLSDVRHVPELKRNLILLSTLDSKGYRYTTESEVSKISKGSLVVMKGQRKAAKLYVLQGSIVTGEAAVASSSSSDDDITKLWHMRLGHMMSTVFLGSKREIHNMKGTLEYIHSDLWGPSRVPSKGGANYMLTFIDDFSRKVWAFFLNNGLEFWSDEFNRLYKSEGIVRHLTVCHTPQQNGIIERMNKTIMEKVRYIDANREPSNYSKAISCEDSEKWMFAMQKEMESLHKNRTWDLVKLPKGKKVVRCKWVFKKKEGTLGVEEPRYKVRLVEKGYSQILGVDFIDVFSPVMKHSSI
ncbi:hypothetical protein CXB51_035376 [Gossypium anomalum]|uniref:Integrase catalytic domain-containing protein n=1 Tax=Gossypium anomalum TaxID=47600 RepID=A0A8J5Y157_9ROSI|nr:hypothetical protein CXB51_035376 [Gossypium anomalum]